MKKILLAVSTLCIAMNLVACGGSDDNDSSNSTTTSSSPTAQANPSTPTNPTTSSSTTNLANPIQNNEFALYNFAEGRENTGNLKTKYSWFSDKTLYQNNAVIQTLTSLTNKTLQEVWMNLPTTITVYDADKKVSSTVDANKLPQQVGNSVKLIDSNHLEFTYPNTDIKETWTIKTVDLSNVKPAISSTSGVNTILDKWFKLYFQNTNFQFPQGSACYVIEHKINKPAYIVIDNHSPTPAVVVDLQAWVKQQQDNLKVMVNGHEEPVKISNLIYDNIDSSGKPTLVHFTDQNGQYHAFSTIPGSITIYTDGNSLTELAKNTDPTKGLVTCEGYNKVAADYIAQQIQLAYPHQ